MEWKNKSRSKEGNRDTLKYFKNCEFEPHIGGDEDEEIIRKVPPPPMHTLLLGPAKHVMKALSLEYPQVVEKLSKL